MGCRIPASRARERTGVLGAGRGAAGMPPEVRKPQRAPTCTAARSELRARLGRAGAPGRRGAGLGGRGAHHAELAALFRGGGPGGIPSAGLPPRLHPAEDTAGPAAAAATGTAARGAAAAAEEVSARGSRFLLPGWASAGEARGGQKPGSPNSVSRDLRGGRSAPSLPTAPCDSARAARPGQASHTRVTAAAVRVLRGLPPLPASPLRDGPSSARGAGRWGKGASGRRPSQPRRRVLARRPPGLRGRGAPRVMKALAAGCAVARRVLGSLFIAGGAARRSRPAALSAGGTARPLFVPSR